MMIRSGHSFARVTTAELSWHVQIYDLIASLQLWLKQRMFSQDFIYEFINPYWKGSEVSTNYGINSIQNLKLKKGDIFYMKICKLFSK